MIGAPTAPLQVPVPSQDAGEVKAGPPLVRTFAFANAGAEPLTISELKASCGCATPTLAQRTYRPGERGQLTLEVNTLSQPAGPNRWTLGVGYQCGEQAGTATVEITAQLVKELDVSPVALRFHGGGESAIRMNVTRPERARQLDVVDVRASAPWIRVVSAGGGEDHRGPPGESGMVSTRVFRVSIAADCPEGTHAESVSILTDDPDYPELKVPVTVVQPPRRRVTAAPAKATLVAGGSVLVQLRDAEGQPVRVATAEASHSALTCRWSAGPGPLTTVRVGLDRGKWDGGELSGEVRVRLESPAGQAVVIPVAARAVE
jgi:hypothetical protein